MADRIHRFNAGRRPEGLQRKYERMRESRGGFFRGTCHLFYEDWPRNSPLNAAPSVWSCGDLHFENLGAYKAANRLVYFDLTDFDEGALAPCTWDVTRFATSILVAARDRRSDAGHELAQLFLETYARGLATGKAGWIERETATGPVRDLLLRVRNRSRRNLLDEHAPRDGRERALRIRKGKTLALTEKERATVTLLLARFARRQERPAFYRVIDAAWRLAGNGSVGVPRYVLLVEGKGSFHRNYLLDLKLARPSALARFLRVRQPVWSSEAERVVAIQTRLQAVAPAYLAAVSDGTSSFVLRELQPQEDRLDLGARELRRKDFATIARAMASVIASAHLRTTGRQGAAVVDELMAWSGDTRWAREVYAQARNYAEQVDRDWREFKTALADGVFVDQLRLGN